MISTLQIKEIAQASDIDLSDKEVETIRDEMHELAKITIKKLTNNYEKNTK